MSNSSQIVLIQTDGAELEAEIASSSTPEPHFQDVGILLIHPYSNLGGSMEDFVVSEFFRQASFSGFFAAVMRYNQRGVGRSKGRRLSFTNLLGQDDANDVPSMVEFLATQIKSPNPRIVIIGYSFGANLGAYGLEDPRVALYIGVSFPLGGLSSLLKTKIGFQKVCAAKHIPRMLILGAMDQYTKVAVLEEAMKAGGGVKLEEERKNNSAESSKRKSDLGIEAMAEVSGASFGRAAAAAMGNSSNADASAPLLLKVFAENTHFWERDCALMVESTVKYIQQVLESS